MIQEAAVYLYLLSESIFQPARKCECVFVSCPIYVVAPRRQSCRLFPLFNSTVLEVFSFIISD